MKCSILRLSSPLFLLPVLFFSPISSASTFQNVNYEVCFTPGNDCTEVIISALKKAKKTLKIQAYSFTSAPIAEAVLDAQKRGVDVQVILDKSQFSAQYSVSDFLLNHKIKVWKDHRVAIAHNKVMIIDDNTVITGSFNFTKAAQQKNAENVIIISDKSLAQQYLKNWKKRMAFSDFMPAS